MILGEMYPEQMGKLFGTVVFSGAALVYVLGRVFKGSNKRQP